ncbi:testis-expressed protein 9 isoform X3 [Bacillus rossius redtenbacheri]|uniref:testis-expressed protein 9 isoform X3 n=1 Tax=Bacillus rossius redtenbacheri TaxID=93214 RepID=UPI002FDD5E91
MGSNFLLKEENFYKINADLEMKTNKLMKEYESVMRLQEQLTDKTTQQQGNLKENACESQIDGRARRPSTSALLSAVPSRGSSARRTQSAVHLNTAGLNRLNPNGSDASSLRKADGGGGGEPLGPEGDLGTEALVSFLRANVKVLQGEVQSLQADLKTRVGECREHLGRLKLAEEEGAKWRQLAAGGKEQLRKLELQGGVAATKLQQREAENAALRKEIESLRKELKTCTQAASSSNVRLNRCLEDMEKLKASVKEIKQEKKELQDESCQKTSELLTVVKRLERQKLELISGFKKQMQLIDNLSRQKIHLEAGRVVQFAEKEFLKLLDSTTEHEEKL